MKILRARILSSCISFYAWKWYVHRKRPEHIHIMVMERKHEKQSFGVVVWNLAIKYVSLVIHAYIHIHVDINHINILILILLNWISKCYRRLDCRSSLPQRTWVCCRYHTKCWISCVLLNSIIGVRFFFYFHFMIKMILNHLGIIQFGKRLAELFWLVSYIIKTDLMLSIFNWRIWNSYY